jgi:hypothetical protein
MKLTKILGYPLVIIFLLLNLHAVYLTAIWGIKYYLVLKWLGVGILAYIFLRRLPFLRKNAEFVETWTHENTHTVVGWLFLHSVHEQRIGKGAGIMYHSGRFGGIFITLAPYCFPLFTYPLLLIWLFVAKGQHFIFDILIGLTVAFHAVCFKKQTGSYQPDIQAYGLPLSYLFITAFLLFNACVIVLSVKMGIVYAYERLFTQYWKDIIMVWKFLS